MEKNRKRVAVIGLGYVGLPLVVEFAKKGFNVLGYDINQKRIDELRGFQDFTDEVSTEDLREVEGKLMFSSNESDLQPYNIFIITVPTPIDKFKQPDLSPLISSSKTIGSKLTKGDIVIYEST